jgi:hypothetical protein
MTLVPCAAKYSVKGIIDVAHVSIIIAVVCNYPIPGIVQMLLPPLAYHIIAQLLVLVVGSQGVYVEIDERFVCSVEDDADC